MQGVNEDCTMPSPKKMTPIEMLSTKKSPPSSRQSKNQSEATTNNGFYMGNSSALLNVFEALNDRMADRSENGSTLESFLLDFPRGFAGRREPSYVENDADDPSKGELCPLEIIVSDNRVQGTFNQGSGRGEARNAEPNSEYLNLQDLRMRENPATKLMVDGSETFAVDTSKYNVQEIFHSKPDKFWTGKRRKVFKYLMCATGILILILSVVQLVFLIRGCWGPEKKVCLTEECVRTAASLLAAMDLTANPCHDFFQYACGTWNKKHVIPEDRSSISTFEIMADQLQVILKGVLEEPFEEHENSDSATRKAKLFYKSCMNIQQIRKIGDAPLRQLLKNLGGWPVATPHWTPPNFSIEFLLGKLRGDYNEGVLIEQWVGPDDKNSSVHILQLDQMQLALPSRDYYLKMENNIELKAYHRYMTQIAILLGADAKTAEAELEQVIKFEVQLANATLPEADRHDTSAIYRKLRLSALQREIPQLNWKEYLSTFLEINLHDGEPVVTYAMPYFVEMGQILKRTDRRIIHNYVIWRLVMKILPHMIDEYQQKIIEFRKILLGILSERHRWSQCVEWTNKKLGMAVGALFIRDNFNQNSKETALEMIHTIREAFNELLTENKWMDDETRAVAKEKADSMNERIGYPELLTNVEELNKEYINLTITEDQFLVNVLNVLKYDAYHNLRKLRQPVNKDKWSTEPAVVNAFYNPNKNDIVFPAGILQPLFYSQHSPKSLNYGGIGVVIGHEITHGFDDKGRQFDKDGNMMQWWNNATIKAFRERTQCIIDQYSRYKLDEVDLFVNGRMTQGENIADNGGLKQSFRAYKKWVAKHGEEPLLPGINLTHDQLFFLNYAQIWCGSMRPEDALTKIRSSVHSPGPVRVLGPLSNSWDFAQAYKCPLKSPMNPTSKCSVW